MFSTLLKKFEFAIDKTVISVYTIYIQLNKLFSNGDDRMKKILLVLTGGTIGSVSRNGVIGTEREKCRVLELYKEKYPDSDCRFDVTAPLNILSENLTRKDWEILINYILSLDLSVYDGIIITHGSDTLSYSSAMLGMCLNHLGIPIVITAANYVPDDPRSNALFNFTAAVRLIEKFSGGVYTVFRNGNACKAAVYIPTRMYEADRRTDRFEPFDSLWLAMTDEKGVMRFSPNFDIHLLERHRSLTEMREVHFDKKVQIIQPYPSMDYDNIPIGENTGAVLHMTYHSGTVSEKALTLLEKCKAKGIPMYLCSLKSEAKNIYETSDILLKNGAIPLYDISKESAYAKLLLAVNMWNDDILGFMKQNIYFEYPEEQ